jgi:hypothetical protein
LESSVLSINLSRAVADPDTLPRSVKLHPSGIGLCAVPWQHMLSCSMLTEGRHVVSRSTANGDDDEETEETSYTVILHPSSSASKLGAAPLPLWRKRETVRQERTVHYTTIDADGQQQVGRSIS